MPILKTICEQERWSGFFGINESGDQPTCNTEVTVFIEDECIEFNPDLTIKSVPPVRCPTCHTLLEWPQEWEIINDPNPSKPNATTSHHFMDLE